MITTLRHFYYKSVINLQTGSKGYFKSGVT